MNRIKCESLVITAVFNPKRLDTLRDEAKPFIGQRLRFIRGWEIVSVEDGHNAYDGQIAWVPYPYSVEPRTKGSWLGWIPQEDLDDIEVCS